MASALFFVRRMISFNRRETTGFAFLPRDGVAMEKEPSISVEAAHAADKQKEITYPPRPGAEAPDFEALRARVLAATKQARSELGNE